MVSNAMVKSVMQSHLFSSKLVDLLTLCWEAFQIEQFCSELTIETADGFDAWFDATCWSERITKPLHVSLFSYLAVASTWMIPGSLGIRRDQKWAQNCI